MSKGKRYIVSGVLSPAQLGYKLEMENGGFWELDISGNVKKLIGQEVTIEGIRMGFNLIFVDKLWFEGRLLRTRALNRIEIRVLVFLSLMQTIMWLAF